MNPKTYPHSEHGLPIEKVDPDAIYVMEKLKNAGHLAFLVGGGVRDLLLKKKPKDFDISTSAKPEEIKKIFRNCILIGKRFRLAHIRFGKKALEVSTFRSGDNETDSLIIRDNNWGTSEEDALRRDFTINGLFYDPFTQTIIDYVDGYPDIQKRYLRTIGQPFLRFKQDPVRMIRLLKFQARFNLEIDQDSKIAMIECREEILKSSQARILEELLKMLESGSARPFFKLITDCGMLQLLMPMLASFLEHPEGNEIFTYLSEIDLRNKETESEPLDRAILLSCLLFPFLQKHLHHHFIEREKTPHLGEIHHEVYHIIDQIFRPFFLLSRRTKAIVISILTYQFKLTPLEKKRHFKIRIPNDPDFVLALQFLEIRASLEPALKTIWEEWKGELSLLKETPPPPRSVRRKRRKKKQPPQDMPPL